MSGYTSAFVDGARHPWPGTQLLTGRLRCQGLLVKAGHHKGTFKKLGEVCLGKITFVTNVCPALFFTATFILRETFLKKIHDLHCPQSNNHW